jgi:hypothetical protein
VKSRGCSGFKDNGQPCQAPKLRESDFCLMHSPEHAADVAEARRLGGLRRRREVVVAGAYDFSGLESVADIRRLLEVAILDALGLENSVARSRTLAYLAMTAIKLLEVGELEQHIASLEGAVHGQKALPKPLFDIEPATDEFSSEVKP